MSGRGYNTNPFEVNVDGTDNLFSREDDCSPDPNGLFGSDQGVEQDLGFYYQVETLPILESAEQVQNEILEQVETSVSKTLLPSLFVEECAVIERTRQKAQIPHRRLAGNAWYYDASQVTLSLKEVRDSFLWMEYLLSIHFSPCMLTLSSSLLFQWNAKENCQMSSMSAL